MSSSVFVSLYVCVCVCASVVQFSDSAGMVRDGTDKIGSKTEGQEMLATPRSDWHSEVDFLTNAER